MKNGRILKKFKKSIGTKVHDATDKISEVGESIDSEVTEIGEMIEEKTQPVKKLSKFHLTSVKKEAADIKNALSKTDLIYMKTDALAVVLRKLGGLDEFLRAVEKLTKEGYLLVWTEPVTTVLPVGFRFAGSFYYFQKGKYVA